MGILQRQLAMVRVFDWAIIGAPSARYDDSALENHKIARPRSIKNHLTALLITMLLLCAQSTHAQCILASTNLVSWWSGDGSGDDIYGNNPAYLPTSGVTFSNGIVGSCFVFGGTDGFAQTTLDVQPTAMPSSPI